ncbi:M24 family metallopeptidase [Amycolatopsis sp. NPDC059021]|uniref:M24 family metallopeptidase n=1 Tax=Amycolatopsis sp. NPDC059021 TaxID=3346704 RepID=UPI003671B482
MTKFVLRGSPPFTEHDYLSRISRVVGQAVEAGLDGLLVAPGPDLLWLTGYQPIPADRRRTMLILRPGTRPALLVPEGAEAGAAMAPGASCYGIVQWTDDTDAYRVIGQLVPAGGRYGISDATWSAHLLGVQAAVARSTYWALGEVLPLLRAVKDDNEVDCLRMAGAAADAAYREITGVRFTGRREKEVAAGLADLLREFGHERADVAVVASGPNGARPRHEPGEREFVPGDVVVLRFGGVLCGYRSHTTRTVVVGESSAEARVIHDVVRAAQQAAFETVAPGVACEELDRVARSVVDEAGYGEWAGHRSGHGIGVTADEPPCLVRGERQPLVPGMCLSIGLGICLPDRFGVRIEDVVAVTEYGGERLNTTNRGLLVVR